MSRYENPLWCMTDHWESRSLSCALSVAARATPPLRARAACFQLGSCAQRLQAATGEPRTTSPPVHLSSPQPARRASDSAPRSLSPQCARRKSLRCPAPGPKTAPSGHDRRPLRSPSWAILEPGDEALTAIRVLNGTSASASLAPTSCVKCRAWRRAGTRPPGRSRARSGTWHPDVGIGAQPRVCGGAVLSAGLLEPPRGSILSRFVVAELRRQASQ